MNYIQTLIFWAISILEGISSFIASVFKINLDLTWSVDYAIGCKQTVEKMLQEESIRSKRRSTAKTKLKDTTNTIIKNHVD